MEINLKVSVDTRFFYYYSSCRALALPAVAATAAFGSVAFPDSSNAAASIVTGSKRRYASCMTDQRPMAFDTRFIDANFLLFPQMRTLSTSTRNLVFCPWPMLDPTLTDPSSSSPLSRLLGCVFLSPFPSNIFCY